MPDLSFENELRARGYQVVAGIDEAGRGPLAGPVMAGAAVLPIDYRHPLLNDSKTLSEKRREEIYEELKADGSVIFASAKVEPKKIDQINILQANYLAMRKAFEALSVDPDIALIDGKPIQHFPKEHQAIIKGDSLSLSIAAASIVAKVERDRIMVRYAKKYPGYGFEKHKGYGTKAHLEALRKLGPCPIHRKSFAPVAELL